MTGLNTAEGQYDGLVQAASQQWGVPSQILQAIGQAESSWGTNPNTYSPGAAGEIGIMQITPAVAQEYDIDPYSAQSSINGAAEYLSKLYSQTGSWSAAVAAYNGSGPAAQTYSSNVMALASQLGYTGAGTSAAGQQPAGATGFNWGQFFGDLFTKGPMQAGTDVAGYSIQNLNWPLIAVIGGVIILVIFSIFSLFKSPEGGSKTTLIPIPV